MAVTAILAGCAAADPTGGAFGKPAGPDSDYQTAGTSGRLDCPAGEMQICELNSPNRVSDGRYGFRKNKQKVCSCQPENEFRQIGQASLPRGNP